tara:strand:- start:650 stop:1729 length:1080 start_codon:yes stop_codon:yes gene_type:complete
MPSSRPRITFNEDGICNACVWATEKKDIDWKSREDELIGILDQYSNKGDSYDVIVPVSGGKDSCYVSWKLKHEYGLTPLLVHIEPPLARDDGNKNLENLIASGYDCLKVAPNPAISREIAFCELEEFGDPLMSWMISVRSIVFRTAINYGVKLIMWGEDGEVEYGGLTKNKNTGFNTLEYHKKIYLSGNNPQKYIGKYTKAELTNWLLPSEDEFSRAGIKSMHFNYFDSWDPYKNFEVAKKYCGFEESESRNSGTYTNFAQTDSYMFDLHCFLMYLKFGFGRCTADACIDIRRKALEREQAITLVKMFDDVSKDLDLEIFANYFQRDIINLKQAIYKHANKELFDIDKNYVLSRKFEII